MANIVRLKRSLCDEPLEALVINYDKETPETKTVFKFAGTIKEQNEDLSKHISKLTKSQLEESFKKHVPDLDSKKIKEFLDATKNKRFQVVNWSRDQSNEDKILAVLDVESELIKKTETSSSDDNFVYDLYYTDSNSFGDLPAGAELDFERYRDIGALEDDEISTDDSNDENNNDYPDDEDDCDMGSVSESDMADAMENMGLYGSD